MVQYVGVGRLGAVQTVAYTGTAGVITNGIGTGVTKVRVAVSSDCYIQISKTPTPTGSTDGSFMAAGSVEYFSIYPGEKVGAIQATAGGNLNVTEIT